MLCLGVSDYRKMSSNIFLVMNNSSPEHFKLLKKFNRIKKAYVRRISFLLFLLPESFDRAPWVGLNIIETIKVIRRGKIKPSIAVKSSENFSEKYTWHISRRIESV